MKKIILLFLSLSFATFTFAQKEISDKYFRALSLLKEKNTKDAYDLFRELKSQVTIEDTLYNYVIYYYVSSTSELESEFRLKEDFENSLKYGLEALKTIQDNKQYFDEKFGGKESWMNKNILVSYFGLGQLDDAKLYRERLYQGYKDKTLPERLDGYFNYDFFKLNGNNIWGYEWYPELPEDRFSSSFTKIVYYVYSTNADGSDKDQLYRFHVLMFHQINKDTKFDYLLERQIETDDAIVSGSYYQYTYKKDIDYKKLKEDIKEIITKEIAPSSRRTIPKRK